MPNITNTGMFLQSARSISLRRSKCRRWRRPYSSFQITATHHPRPSKPPKPSMNNRPGSNPFGSRLPMVGRRLSDQSRAHCHRQPTRTRLIMAE